MVLLPSAGDRAVGHHAITAVRTVFVLEFRYWLVSARLLESGGLLGSL